MNKSKATFDAEQLLAALEEVAVKIGVKIRYESIAGGPIKTTSGSCRIRGEDVVFIDRRMSSIEKVHALGHELRRFNLDEVFLPPAVRRFLQLDDAD